jgi:hypothetical protein
MADSNAWMQAAMYSNPYGAAIGAAADVIKNDPGNSLNPSIGTPINTGGFTLNVGSGHASSDGSTKNNAGMLPGLLQNPLVIGAVVLIVALLVLRRK